jgi:hypothetical protein
MRIAASSSAVVLAAALLAACGGGGGTSLGGNTIPNNPGSVPQSTQSISVTFAGTQTLAKVRSPQDLASVPITVTVNGVVVGTGTLDGNGHAKIKFTVPVQPGSTITVTAGHLTATATLAMGTKSTAILITVNADGTISVKSAGDPDDKGVVDPNDPEQEDETEDGHGNVTSITATGGNVLPANAPFTLTRNCTTITLTPANAAVASIKFEEKGSDDESDDAGRVRFEGAFTGPLTFPISAASARLHIEIFDAQHHRLIEVKAPISAFTSGTSTGASPCPSPTATATATATARASATPEPSESPHASPAPTATPSATPTPR